MSSSILTGGTGRAYGFDIENVVKSPSMTSSRNSHSSSPSSTLSESSNSPRAISNRKPRTPRKRPNQTYNEAAVLLSIACPKVFSSKNITNKTNNLSKFTTQNGNSVYNPPELLLPFPVIENSGFLLQNPIPEKPGSVFESKVAGSSQSPDEFEYQNCNSGSNSMELCDGFEGADHLGATVGLIPCDLEVTGSSRANRLFQKSMVSTLGPSWPNTTLDPTHAEASCIESALLSNEFENDFDTESMLDEEIEEGIDSIMGSPNSTTENQESNKNYSFNSKTCYGYPMGLGFGGNLEFNFGIGMRNGIRALKNGDDGNWWSFPAVNVVDVSPPAVAPVKVKKIHVEKKKKKKVEELMKRPESELELELKQENGNHVEENGCKLLLKLNYDDVLNAWSDKGSPLPEEISGSESTDGDIHTRLAQIDLFSENGGLREASVMRYKEKKRTRLFSKKIRYQVRKVNADRRPRSKGRFVRRSNSEDT